MTTTQFWQIVCGSLAIGAPVGGALRIVRMPRWHVAVLIGQLLLVPEAALVLQALHPGPLPNATEMLAIVAVLAGAAFLALAISLWRRRRLFAGVVEIVSVERQHRAAFAARTFTILMISGFVFTFAPWFAAVNLLAYGAWIAIWIPRRLRTIDIAVTEDIAAAPHAVFETAIDPVRWLGTKGGTVAIEPNGPIRVGSKVVARHSLHRLSSNSKIARYVETKTVVTSIEPDRGYATVLADHPDVTGGLDLTPAPVGTRATNWSKSRLSLAEAVSGLFWELPAVVATRKAEMRDRLASIKRAAEGAASQ